MTFKESLTWLYSTQQFGIKLGLENTERLLESLGNPQDALRIVHVAGTNGKGSVCAMADAILREGGHRCGLYTSPHLVDFRERIRVDGRMIPREVVADVLTRLRKTSSGWAHCPTFFEFCTVLALEYFSRSGCDAVVLETGMGGQLDATNVVSPAVSVITPIAMDHAEWLGSTLGAIAGEKAGIIKPGVPVVSALQNDEVRAVLETKARAAGSGIPFVAEPWIGVVALPGAHQQWNAALAIAALEAGGFDVSGACIERGLANVRWPARFDEVAPGLVIDGAHNPHSAAVLVETWRARKGEQKATVIFGAMKDKDYTEMLTVLAPIAREFFFVPVASARAAAPADFVSRTTVPSVVFSDLKSAIGAARERSEPVVVTGSLFLAGDAFSALGLDPG